jgi:hypothetical protein
MMSGGITYNVVRHGDDPAILCAVPNDRPLPSSLINVEEGRGPPERTTSVPELTRPCVRGLA